ncbi:uncharacterized protein TNCV_2178801 [Trichonephila clavipes]|uniref:Uncharacterized protein n=1 Tax=Trichonephila clavipes TaxID=2585209 RepID=A0A8X6VUB9_TRICX|nr:uncharacterized protein TNCV_2178801 [Trichonephila clavipes]
MASAVLADPTRAQEGTNRGSGPAMEESENDVGSLEQLLLYAEEHYLAGELPLGDHLGKNSVGGIVPLSRVPPHPYTRLSSVPKTNRDSSLNTTFCQYVTFHIDLVWHHCRRSSRCYGVKGSARKGLLDLRFASARCLEIVCGTIDTPTSARIVERVTGGSTSACRTILRSSLLVVFLVTPGPVFRAWVPSRVHCSQQFLTAHSERSTWPETRRVDQPAVFIPMIRPLSNSLNLGRNITHRFIFYDHKSLLRGHGCQVFKVKDSWLASHKFEPSAAQDPPCRGGRSTLNLSQLKRSHVDVVWKFGEGDARSGVIVT